MGTACCQQYKEDIFMYREASCNSKMTRRRQTSYSRSRSRSINYSSNSHQGSDQDSYYRTKVQLSSRAVHLTSRDRERNNYINNNIISNNDLIKNILEGPLMAFKDFIILQENNIEPDVAVTEYEKYKEEYSLFHARNFFEHFKSSGLLVDRYHPNVRIRNFEEQIKVAKFNAAIFLEEYNNHKFKNIKLSIETISNKRLEPGLSDLVNVRIKNEIKEDSSNKKNLILSGPPYYIRYPGNNSLILYNIPDHVYKWDIYDAIQDQNGLLCVFINYVKFGDEIQRNAICCFDSNDNLVIARDNLTSGQKIVKGWQMTFCELTGDYIGGEFVETKIVSCLFNDNDRISHDLNMTKQLIKKFDYDYGVSKEYEIGNYNHPIFDNCQSDHSAHEMLDIQLLYLRRVHNICYYSGEKYLDGIQAWEECGPICLRGDSVDDSYEFTEKEKALLKTFDGKIEKLLEDKVLLPEAVTEDSTEVASLWQAYCDEHTLKVEEDRYRCDLCKKLFKGPHFVHKHLKNKHTEYLNEIIDQVGEKHMREVYISDNKKLSHPCKKFNERNVKDINRMLYSKYETSSNVQEFEQCGSKYSRDAAIGMASRQSIGLQSTNSSIGPSNSVTTGSTTGVGIKRGGGNLPAGSGGILFGSGQRPLPPPCYTFHPPPSGPASPPFGPASPLSPYFVAPISHYGPFSRHIIPPYPGRTNNFYKSSNSRRPLKPYVDLDQPKGKLDGGNEREASITRSAVSYDDL